MKVFVTGGTGFVGRHVLKELVESGHDVRALCRSGSEGKIPDDLRESVKLFEGDILNKQRVLKGCKGVDAVINLVGIIREFPKRGITFERLHEEGTFNCVLAAQQQGVDKFIQMSALGTGEGAESEYHKSKYRAEVLVKNSGLNHVIFRPSIIFGEGDDAIGMIERGVESNKFFPLIGRGKYKWQPVHVKDVAKAFVMALDDEEDAGVKNQVVECGGPDVFEFREIVDLVAECYGENVLKVPVPTFLVRIPTFFFQYQGWYPLSLDMLKMIGTDNVVSGKSFEEFFDIGLTSLEEYLESRS